MIGERHLKIQVFGLLSLQQLGNPTYSVTDICLIYTGKKSRKMASEFFLVCSSMPLLMVGQYSDLYSSNFPTIR